MAKSVPRMPATEEIPSAGAPFVVGVAVPAEDEPVGWPVAPVAEEPGALVTVGRLVYRAVDW